MVSDAGTMTSVTFIGHSYWRSRSLIYFENGVPFLIQNLAQIFNFPNEIGLEAANIKVSKW